MNSFFFKKTIARFLPRCNLRNHNKPHETHPLIFPQQRTSPNFSNWGSNFAQFVQNSIDSGMYYIVQCRKYTINRHQLNISLSLTDNLEDKKARVLKLMYFLKQSSLCNNLRKWLMRL